MAGAATAKGAEKDAAAGEEDAGGKPRGGRKKLLLIAVPVLLLALGGGFYASGLLDGLLGKGGGTPGEVAQAASGDPAAPRPPSRPPVFMDMPEIVANLNTGGRRASYVKLRSKLEIGRAEDAAPIQAAMPRLLDLFTTYLREMRPEELRGSAGTARLREELLARASVALATAVPPGQPQPRVTDVLFVEILQQ
jgi:flagellar protein FliL